MTVKGAFFKMFDFCPPKDVIPHPNTSLEEIWLFSIYSRFMLKLTSYINSHKISVTEVTIWQASRSYRALPFNIVESLHQSNIIGWVVKRRVVRSMLDNLFGFVECSIRSVSSKSYIMIAN